MYCLYCLSLFPHVPPALHVLPGKGHVVAAGDPQKPQGFNPVQSQVIWPGDHLTVACDFDSSDKSVSVGAGPTHEHEMCNMYLMVYSALPHIEMCSDGSSMVDERSPGNMPRAAALLPDPFPLWKPPAPTDAANKVGLKCSACWEVLAGCSSAGV
jgi:hypothetical protein